MEEVLTEAEALMERAHERLEAASLLLREGMLADAVSRAYYAAFNAAKAVLLLLGSRPRTHEGLRSEFALRVVRAGLADRRLGRILSKLAEAREEGDYSPVFLLDEGEVRELVDSAREFVSAMEDLLSRLRESAPGPAPPRP